MKKRLYIILSIGVIAMMLISACGGQKYKLNFDGSFESKKTEYSAGENVTVYYSLIATDTDYRFSIDDDVEMKQDYDNEHGYIFTFKMPAHDVTLHEESQSSMMYDPDADWNRGTDMPEDISEEELAAELDEASWIFDYYDAVTGTVGGDGYDEMVLYARAEGDGLILASYSKWGDEEESVNLILVPESVFDDCMEVVDEYDMKNWKDGIAITGGYTVVKFKEGGKTDGEVTRVTSEDMPEDGFGAFSAVESTLGAAWAKYSPSGD